MRCPRDGTASEERIRVHGTWTRGSEWNALQEGGDAGACGTSCCVGSFGDGARESAGLQLKSEKEIWSSEKGSMVDA